MIIILYFACRISFGIISELKFHTTEDDVKHLDVDLQDANSIIYLAGNNLYNFKLNSSEPVIDRLTEDGHLSDLWYLVSLKWIQQHSNSRWPTALYDMV